MPLLEKFSVAGQLKSGLGHTGKDPTSVVFDTLNSATEGVVDGRTTILAGTNNYLGLTFDPACIAAGVAAMQSQGTGTTGSRMANGSYAAHGALEAELADLYQCPSAMVFSTGYAANLGVLTALLGKDDAVLLDSDAHASLYDGCRMSEADIYRFKHNDVQSLERRIARLGDRARRCRIVVEGMYSVLGDRAPLKEIAEVKERFGARLLVDEAHSLGVYGKRGWGVAEEQGVLEQVDLLQEEDFLDQVHVGGSGIRVGGPGSERVLDALGTCDDPDITVVAQRGDGFLQRDPRCTVRSVPSQNRRQSGEKRMPESAFEPFE